MCTWFIPNGSYMSPQKKQDGTVENRNTALDYVVYVKLWVNYLISSDASHFTEYEDFWV